MKQPSLTSFRTPAALRAWFRKHHGTATELLLRCFRTDAADRGVTYTQALDEALCFGWIDGVRRRVDADSFCQRFTPRRPRSTWSRVNMRRVERLIEAGRMTEAGLAAFHARGDERTGVYSFEQRSIRARAGLPPDVPGQPGRLGLLSGGGAVLQAHEHVLGHEREAGGDQGQAARDARRVLGAAHADSVVDSIAPIVSAGRAGRLREQVKKGRPRRVGPSSLRRSSLT